MKMLSGSGDMIVYKFKLKSVLFSESSVLFDTSERLSWSVAKAPLNENSLKF